MFFKEFPGVSYKFGNETTNTFVQDLSTYVDIIDDIKDSIDFYNYYDIVDERPDQLSFKLYGDVSYYWTFYLLNDNIRRQGWPVKQVELDAWIKKRYFRTVVTTRDSLDNVFPIGSPIDGTLSCEVCRIDKRVEDLGQLFLRRGGKVFIPGELVEDGDGNTVTVYSFTDEYNAVKHYLDENGNRVDINPLEGPGALYTPVTYYDFLVEENDKLRRIKVLKPEAINSVVSAYKEALRSQ
jgi:hypothetical protein